MLRACFIVTRTLGPEQGPDPGPGAQIRVGDVRLMLPCGESAPPEMLLSKGTGLTAAALTELDPEEITTSLLDVYAQRTPMCVLILGSFQATTLNAQVPREPPGEAGESPRVTVDSEMGTFGLVDLKSMHGNPRQCCAQAAPQTTGAA